VADTASGQNEIGSRSGIFGSSQSKESNAGKAGNILVQANQINLTDGGVITTGTANTTGGSITVTTPVLLYLREGQITTSVKGGKGDGGNITIESPTFVIMDDGKIIAQAHEGHGGNINLKADQFIKSTDSLISASSKLGIDGSVEVNSPEINMDEFLVVLPGGFIENVELPKPCQFQDVNELSTFKKRTQREGIPMAPGFQE